MLCWLRVTSNVVLVACHVCVCCVQDNPEQGVLYLLRGLLNIVQDYSWETQAESQALFYLDALVMLTAASQEYYIYHADGGMCKLFSYQHYYCIYKYIIHYSKSCVSCVMCAVESNETLYGYDPKFLAELTSISTTLVEQIITHIEKLDKHEVDNCCHFIVLISS